MFSEFRIISEFLWKNPSNKKKVPKIVPEHI